MSETTADLAARIDDAVRGVAGVSELYFASALPARLWRVALDREATYAAVTSHDGRMAVVVSIGVAGGRADDVARRVGARVREVVGDPSAEVTVRVSRLAAADRP